MKIKEKDNEQDVQLKKPVKRLLKSVGIAIICIAVLMIIAVIYIANTYKLNKIQVTGSEHYTDEEIIDIVTNNKKTSNTVLFYLENKLHPIENVTFIDKFQIEIIGRDTVTITVYEKSMAGCVMYMDQYVYFDDEGVVLETAPEKLPDVPCINGLSFDSIVVGEALPVEDKKMFQNILTMTQLIEKNNLIIDEIRFNNENELTLRKENIKIKLGESSNLEDKLMNLSSILDELKGKNGTLDMSNYDANAGNAIFKENK